MKKSKSTIEHHDDDSKGNVNTNTINIKNSINLGDLVKQLKAKPKAKSKKKGGGEGEDQMPKEQIQGPPGMPGQAGMPGLPGLQAINSMPNQPFMPQQPSMPLLAQLEKSYSAIEKDLETAKKLGIAIPEELKINQASQQVIDPTDSEQLIRIIDELDRDDASIRTILSRDSMPPLQRSDSTQSVASGLPPPPLPNRSNTLENLAFSNRLPIKEQPPDIFSSSTGERSLERISSNSVKPKTDDNFDFEVSPINNRPSIFPPTQNDDYDKKRMRELKQENEDNAKLFSDWFDAGGGRLPSNIFDNNSTASGLMPPLPFYNMPPPQERLKLQNSDKVLRLEQNKLEKAKNDALKEKPRDIEKLRNIDNQLKDIRNQRESINPNLNPVVDNNSTQSGLQLARSDSNKLYAPLPSSNFFSDVLALKNAPAKTQQQLLKDLINEPLNFQEYTPPNQTTRTQLRVREPRVKKNYEIIPETRQIVEDVRKFRQDVERSRNIPQQSSLLEQITTRPTPPPPERNLLGQAFGAFSNLLSSSRDVRDASAYGGVALGVAQPELLPAIGALETANQALNIIEAPVGSIERAIQQRIENPPPPRKRKDAYGGF